MRIASAYVEMRTRTEHALTPWSSISDSYSGTAALNRMGARSRSSSRSICTVAGSKLQPACPPRIDTQPA